MAGAKLEKTRWPGIYRRGQRWAYEWTDAQGGRRRGTAGTREEASAHKAQEEERARRGALPDTGTRERLTLADYALDLFGADLDRPEDAPRARGRFQGRRGAIRQRTLDTYRRDLENHVLPVLGRYKLAAIRSQHIKRLLADLAARDGDDYLRDKTLRSIFAPLRGMLAEAAEEGIIDHNPAAVVKVPSGRDALRDHDGREDQDADADDPAPGKARALTREQLATFLMVVHPDWRPLFELLAVTGLRISEAAALRWQDLVLNGDRPHVRVRRSYVAPRFGPPKSVHGKRDVPIAWDLADRFASRRASAEFDQPADLVFPSQAGTPLRTENVRRRVLKPAAEEAGVWVGFHSFRHTCASTLIADGRNIVQVSRWLGHHSPAFTLTTYAHLLDEGVGEPLSPPVLGVGGVGSGSGLVLRPSSVGLEGIGA